MSHIIDKLLSENNRDEIFEECKNFPSLGKLLYKILITENMPSETIKVMLYCNWTTSFDLCYHFNKMSKGDCRWNKIQLVSSEPADFYVVINRPPVGVIIDYNKTILFRMEPNMDKNIHLWQEWANPNKDKFLYAGFHDSCYNNLEWHISKSYIELLTEKIHKSEDLSNILTSIVSSKYNDIGHIKRINFLKFLETKEDVNLNIFGFSNSFNYKNYKGQLPYHCKDDALLPYKYTFNAENNSIHNYFTEKIIDGILSECLTFYWGCPNIGDYIDSRAFVILKLDDFESDYIIIKRMIEEDEWTKRIDIIRKEKKKILNDLQFFPRIEKIIQNKK